MKEKRTTRRYFAFHAPFYCQKSDRDAAEINVSNISSSGIGITMSEKVSKSDRLMLELILPEDDIPMFVIAEVVWAAEKPDMSNKYHAGIRMEKIHPSDKKRLVRYIHSNFVCAD
ncbi:MAG: PilZ domain-containing protein [Candidatus Omnitrophica bacterium]|nr:PilZ domain-containing protein [Candidatus Omnitrophota bacterium]